MYPVAWLQEQCALQQKQLRAESAAAHTARADLGLKQASMHTDFQALQKQLADLRSDHQELQEKCARAEAVPAATSQSTHPASRPSVLNGVKAMLQKLNGSQNQQTLLPVSVPSLVIGHQQGAVGHQQEADTPPYSARAASSSAAAFRHDSQGTSPQPEGTAYAAQGSSGQEAGQAHSAGPSGQQEDEWDVLLR